MIILVAAAFAVILADCWYIGHLRKEIAMLRHQRNVAHTLLNQAQKYADQLEKDQLEVRKIVGARLRERTPEAVKVALTGRRRMLS